jgi:hypothetical protein
MTGREFVAGVERTHRAIHAYLEGVVALRRFDYGQTDEEIIDTVLRLFLATTKQKSARTSTSTKNYSRGHSDHAAEIADQPR